MARGCRAIETDLPTSDGARPRRRSRLRRTSDRGASVQDASTLAERYRRLTPLAPADVLWVSHVLVVERTFLRRSERRLPLSSLVRVFLDRPHVIRRPGVVADEVRVEHLGELRLLLVPFDRTVVRIVPSLVLGRFAIADLNDQLRLGERRPPADRPFALVRVLAGRPDDDVDLHRFRSPHRTVEPNGTVSLKTRGSRSA